MLKWIYGVFFFIVIAGMWMIFHFGIRPKAVSVVKPSYFATPRDAGELIHRVLYPRIALHSVIFWGTRLEESAQLPMFDGFLNGAQSSERPFQSVIFVGMHHDGAMANALEVMDLPSGGSELTRVLQNNINQGKRTLVVLNVLETAHFVKSSEVLEQESALKTKIISIVTIPLAASEGEYASVELEPCVVTHEAEKTPLSLGCLQAKQNRQVLKKQSLTKNKFPQDKFTLIIDQEGERDYATYHH